MPRLYFSTENASRSLFHTIVSEVDQEIIVAEEPSDPEKMFRRAYELLGHSPRLEERIERIRDVFELYARAADTHLHDRILFELSNRHPRRQPMFERFRAFEISEAAAVYRRRFAAASSFTYVLTGDFETEQVRPWILRVLGGLPREAVAEAWQDRGIRDVTGVHSFELPASSLDHALVEVLFYGPATWTPESEIELQALARAVEIFLRQELRERFSLTYHLAVGAEISSHPGRGYRLWIRFSCAPGEVDESMGPLFFGLANFSRIAKLVDTVRAQLLLEHEAMLQSEAGWAHLLRQYLARGQDPRDIPERSVLIERLSARRLRELAEETIDFERYILGVLDPEAEPREDG